jgi:hypothetical protein
VYNYQEFKLASDEVQQTLSNDFIQNDKKIAHLLRAAFMNKPLPKKILNFDFITSAHYVGYIESRGWLRSQDQFLLIFPLKKIMRINKSNLTIKDLKENDNPIEIQRKSDGLFRIFEVDQKLFVLEADILHIVYLVDGYVESIECPVAAIQTIAYACYSHKYDVNKYGIEIKEWNLVNFSSATVKNASIVFERILNKPLKAIHWDKYFNELQWAYEMIIDGTNQIMWCAYKQGQATYMQSIDIPGHSSFDMQFVGNRMMAIHDYGDVWLVDRLTGMKKSFKTTSQKCRISPNGLLNVRYVANNIFHLCHQDISINNLGIATKSIAFISNRFYMHDNALVDLKGIKDSYKKLSGNKFYIQRIPKEEKQFIA